MSHRLRYGDVVSNAHRIAWIDAQVRAGRYPNARTIAERFEISRRQAARDLEYLRHSLGAPLVYERGHNGYLYADDGFTLTGVLVSEAERSALRYLAHQYEVMPGEPAVAVAEVLRRLAGHVVVDRPSPAAPLVATIDAREMRVQQALEWAIENRRKVKVRYRGADGVIVPRTVSPLALSRRRGLLCCAGYYDELGEIVWLPVGRFETADATEEVFEVPPYFGVHEDDATLYSDPFVAVVRLRDAADAERLEGSTLLDDGTVRIEFYDSGAVLSALLSCLSPFEIVSPAWLRRRLRHRLEAVAAINPD